MNKIKVYLFQIVKVLVVYFLPGGKIRDLFMWPITSRLLGQDYVKTIKLKADFFMRAYLGDQLGRMMLFYGDKYEYFWEPTTVRIIEKLVPKARNILLAGSHVGLLVLYARKTMKLSDSVVHTFEPEEDLYKISQHNFDLNANLGKIVLNKEGLSNDTAKAYIVSDTLRSHVVEQAVAGAKTINLTTIDQYIAKNEIGFLDFILLDVEGLEYEVFHGATDLLNNNRPRDIIFEVSPRMLGDVKKSDKVFDLLKEKGYRFYIINDDYSFKQINKHSQEKEIVSYDQNFLNFKDKDYFNVYATQRSEDDIIKIGINL